MKPIKTPLELIADERRRQIEVKGWTHAHDDEHTNHELCLFAALLAMPASHRDTAIISKLFPFAEGCINDPRNESERMRELVKAGALIMAEIERLQRGGQMHESEPTPK